MARGSRLFRFVAALIIVLLLIYFGWQGALDPIKNILAIPFNFVQGGLSNGAQGISDFFSSASQARKLEKRNKDLEEALAVYQAQLADLQEKGHDYDRLAALLEFDRQGPEDREYVTCNVIGSDTTGFIRAIQIDCGRRDGVSLLDPVVVEVGMVGRVVQVSATGAEVLLLNDTNSSVNARLQDSRADGVVMGQLSGDLLMSFIPPDAQVEVGDTVKTNGLGQTFPADVLIGRVISVTLAQNELYQEARVRSLVDFDRLEIVQVIINFEPVDLSVFTKDNQTTP